jgi:small membrane protein
MKIVLIQLVLIVVVVLIAVRLLRDRGARTQAVRRLGLLLFAAFAVWSILFPSVWNQIAKVVGVGRGTDMVLYALVVAFLSFTLTTYVRFREFEARYTKLARRLALDEADPPQPAHTEPEQPVHTEPEQQETPYAGS